jgi:ribosomal protein S18 acetylase RimI-like enzyme
MEGLETLHPTLAARMSFIYDKHQKPPMDRVKDGGSMRNACAKRNSVEWFDGNVDQAVHLVPNCPLRTETFHVQLSRRNFRGDEDVPRVKTFLTGRERWDGLPDYWNAGKSTVATYQAMFEGPPSNHQFWEDAEHNLQVYLWLSPELAERVDGFSNSWRVLMHPATRSEQLLTQALVHAETELAAASADRATGERLSTVAYGEDQWMASLLERHGYVRGSPVEVYMTQALDREIELPSLADGYRIRRFDPQGDLIQRSGVQVDAFAGLSEPDDWSIENTRRFIRWYQGRDDVDLVVESATGEIASFAVFLVDSVTGLGELDPVGTRSAHQRRGLSKAVLLSGLNYLKGNGLHSAVVRTGVENVAAIRSYQSVGFRVVDRLFRYTKQPDARG